MRFPAVGASGIYQAVTDSEHVAAHGDRHLACPLMTSRRMLMSLYNCAQIHRHPLGNQARQATH
jgi:hypothetical protein